MKIDFHKFKNSELETAMSLIKDIKSHGYEAYAVGGCVRDMVRVELGQTKTASIHDIDIATNMPIDELQKAFDTRSNNGEAHGTILVLYREGGSLYGNQFSFEVTQFRTDGNYSDGRHPDSVQFANTFMEDASRRDLTINALGMDCDGEVIDYFGGVNDIEHRFIRTVGDPRARFAEDSLRIIRAIRFATVFGYLIEDNTKLVIKEMASAVERLSPERIRKEFLAVVEKNAIFSSFFFLLKSTTVAEHIPALRYNFLDNLYEMLPKLYRYNKDTGVSASVNSENLIPLIAFQSSYTEKTLDGFVATREERRLLKYYEQFATYFTTTPSPNARYPWTKMVEFVEGDYKNVLWFCIPFHFSDEFYQQIAVAKFLSQNKPDFKAISARVKDMGIAPGPEFGKEYSILVEEAYEKKANMLTKELITTIGRSTVHYKLCDVD